MTNDHVFKCVFTFKLKSLSSVTIIAQNVHHLHLQKLADNSYVSSSVYHCINFKFVQSLKAGTWLFLVFATDKMAYSLRNNVFKTISRAIFAYNN